MILPADIQALVLTAWSGRSSLIGLVPGGLWLSGAVPSGARVPYASFVVTEAEPQVGSNYTIRTFDVALTVWSDAAAESAGLIAREVEEAFSLTPADATVNGGYVIRVRPGSADAEITPGARNANDITITRLRRRVVTGE